MLCIRSLPGERASRARVVTRPYTTAQAAHTRATTTPWFVRKLLNRNPPRSGWRAARGCSRAQFSHGPLPTSAPPGVKAGAVYRVQKRKAVSATWDPKPATGLRGAGALLLPLLASWPGRQILLDRLGPRRL